MWLTYSLIEVFQWVSRWEVVGTEGMTGLPEYRNGGLLVALNVLTLKPNVPPIDPSSALPRLPPSHPAIVEWRAMTMIELDRIADTIRRELSLTLAQLILAQVLEGATWKAGREGPPIEIESDGAVF